MRVRPRGLREARRLAQQHDQPHRRQQPRNVQHGAVDVAHVARRLLDGEAAALEDGPEDDPREADVGVWVTGEASTSAPGSQLGAHAATLREGCPLGPRGEPSPLLTTACNGGAFLPPPKVADVTAFGPPGLLKQPESDVVLLEAFVYVCRTAGL